jgi:hypothetical protein
MGEHLQNWIELLTTRLSHLIGILAGVGTIYTANAPPPIDIMEFIWFSVGNVTFSTSSLMTIMGAITATVITVASVYKTIYLVRHGRDLK